LKWVEGDVQPEPTFARRLTALLTSISCPAQFINHAAITFFLDSTHSLELRTPKTHRICVRRAEVSVSFYGVKRSADCSLRILQPRSSQSIRASFSLRSSRQNVKMRRARPRRQLTAVCLAGRSIFSCSGASKQAHGNLTSDTQSKSA
jgi:hypothetical protein